MQEVLDTLQPLSRDRFLMLVGNWYRVNRGKFKIPTFAHKELDLHRVFWEVQARGGSDMVTAEKMWKVIIHCLQHNLPASHTFMLGAAVLLHARSLAFS